MLDRTHWCVRSARIVFLKPAKSKHTTYLWRIPKIYLGKTYLRSDTIQVTQRFTWYKKWWWSQKNYGSLRNDSFKRQFVKYPCGWIQTLLFYRHTGWKNHVYNRTNELFLLESLEDHMKKSHEIEMENSHEEADSEMLKIPTFSGPVLHVLERQI